MKLEKERYGLVWEDKEEDVAKRCDSELPLLKEVCINRLLTLVAEIGHKIATVEPSEFAEQLSVALHEQRVKASHMLADAIDNQVFIIAEIGQKLRTEYKDYLK